MSGEMNTQRRRSSLSERMKRAFSSERPSSRSRSRDQDYIGPRRLSWSEHIQQAFHREKPQPPSPTADDQDYSGRDLNPGSHRSSWAEHGGSRFYQERSNRVRFSDDRDYIGPRRSSFSENIQRAFHPEKSGGARLTRNRDSAGRDLNIGSVKKPPTQRDAVPSKTPGLSLPPNEAGMAGAKPKPKYPTPVAISSTSPASSTVPSHRPKPLSQQNVTQGLSEGTFQSGPRSGPNEAGTAFDSLLPQLEMGNANKREKRATIRLEAERMELERRIKRLEEAERRQFELRMEALRDAERKEFDSRMETIQREQKKAEDPATIGQENRVNDPTKKVEPDIPNGTTVTQKKRRRLTKKQPFYPTTSNSNSRPASVRSDTSRSSRFSSATFTSLFSSKAASRSRSNSSNWENRPPSEQPSTERNVTEATSLRRLSLNPQESFLKAVSKELASRKNPLLIATPSVPSMAAPGHEDTYNTDEYDPDEEYFTPDEFD